MLFCFQNCLDLLWKTIDLLIEKNVWHLRLNAKNLQIFYSNSERSVQFLEHNAILTCFWRFLGSNILEQFKLEKNNWDLETYRNS